MLADGSRFDLIVIGGGINGAAIAREAQLAGAEVLLLESDDFCSGTSAASTRLIHGGLRYLEHAEISLVYESLSERERLLRLAPHLVAPLEIYLPIARGSRRGRLTIRAGMWLYDLLSVRKSLPWHRFLSAHEMGEELPGLKPDGLVGGAAYFDAQVEFPERLVLENLLDAEQAGATLASHTRVSGLIVESGRIAGVEWEADGASGRALAPVVVNAAGPWVDAVLGPFGGRPLIGGTRGSHLIAEAFAGAPAHAVYAEAESDGRPFFVIPWNGLYLIGTTDVRFSGDPGEAAIDADEYRYLIAETRKLFPEATDLVERVCYCCSGIRPLPATEGVREGAITRRHQIRAHTDIDGLFSVIGGKLTTHRSLAVDCLRKLASRLSLPRSSPTVERPLPGTLPDDDRDALLTELESTVGQATAARLWRTYGGFSESVLRRVEGDGELGRRVGPASDLLVAELVHAIENEHARTLVDLLQRRTMVGLGADFGSDSAAPAADWLVRLGLWDTVRAARELEAYGRFARHHAVPPPGDRR